MLFKDAKPNRESRKSNITQDTDFDLLTTVSELGSRTNSSGNTTMGNSNSIAVERKKEASISVEVDISNCFGRHLPPEIVTHIFEYAILSDRTAVILPAPTPLLHLSVAPEEGQQMENVAVTSSSPLHRTCKASRFTYYTMFKPKALSKDGDGFLAIVVDLEFEHLRSVVKRIEGGSIRTPFRVRLAFTNEFLSHPTDSGIERWLDHNSGRDWKASLSSFDYINDPMPRKYVNSVRNLLNSIIFKRNGHVYPQLLSIARDISKKFEDRSIIADGEYGDGQEDAVVGLEEDCVPEEEEDIEDSGEQVEAVQRYSLRERKQR